MRSIVEDIGAVIELMRGDATFDWTFDQTFSGGAPYYMFGHRLEISNRLTEMEKNTEKKNMKYPLIALRLDIPEERSGGIVQYTLNLLIVTLTNKTYNAEERLENTFKPILYPIYELFIEKLQESGLFVWQSPLQAPRHTTIDRYYYGKAGEEANIAHLFNDPLDAIEIVNLKLTKIINC